MKGTGSKQTQGKAQQKEGLSVSESRRARAPIPLVLVVAKLSGRFALHIAERLPRSVVNVTRTIPLLRQPKWSGFARIFWFDIIDISKLQKCSWLVQGLADHTVTPHGKVMGGPCHWRNQLWGQAGCD